MRKEILNENKGKSGIYMITNKLTEDVYIGQSRNISNRFKNYFNLSDLKSERQFYNKWSSIKIWILVIFLLTILEYCEKSKLLVREQDYLEKFNPTIFYVVK
jgi:group I intron endonuclease